MTYHHHLFIVDNNNMSDVMNVFLNNLFKHDDTINKRFRLQLYNKSFTCIIKELLFFFDDTIVVEVHLIRMIKNEGDFMRAHNLLLS